VAKVRGNRVSDVNPEYADVDRVTILAGKTGDSPIKLEAELGPQRGDKYYQFSIKTLPSNALQCSVTV